MAACGSLDVDATCQEPAARPPSRASIRVGLFGSYSALIRVIRRYSRLIPGPCAKPYSPPHIRSYPQISASSSRAVCQGIFAATYSQLSAVYSRLFCYKRITRIKARIKVNSIWNKPSLRIFTRNKRVDVNNVRISLNMSNMFEEKTHHF